MLLLLLLFKSVSCVVAGAGWQHAEPCMRLTAASLSFSHAHTHTHTLTLSHTLPLSLPLSAAPAAARRCNQPALYEAFGLTVVEAMTCGLPTFATCSGGPSEIIKHGKSGFHLDPYHGDQARMHAACAMRNACCL